MVALTGLIHVFIVVFVDAVVHVLLSLVWLSVIALLHIDIGKLLQCSITSLGRYSQSSINRWLVF